MKRLLLIGPILSAVMLVGCGETPSAAETTAFTIKNDSIHLHDAASILQRIKTAQPTTDSLAREVITAGTVQAIPTQFAYIASPFDGRVTKSYVRMGQKVNALTPLFEIISHDFTELQKEYYQAESERELARKDLARKEELIKKNLCSEREYEEAVNEMRLADREYENARAALQIHHVDPDNMTLGQPLIVRAPIAGEVIENNIVAGLYLSADADPVAIVANLNEVWITAQAKEKDIRFIQEGDKMIIHVNAHPGKSIEGTVYHIEEAVDEETRSIRVLSVCDNRVENLKLGMYATVHFYGKPEPYTVVAEKAIMQGENDSYILAKVDDKCFVRRPVSVDITKDGKAYLSSGLHPSETVISEGGYYFQ